MELRAEEEETLLEEAEGVMVLTPPPMVETMTLPDASVELMTWPFVKDEDVGADVDGGDEEGMLEGMELVGATDEADVGATVGEVEAASMLEPDGAGTSVDPCAIGGTGVATLSEVDAGAGVEAWAGELVGAVPLPAPWS